MAECVLSQALSQLSARGRVRLALDWTSEDSQHLLVISLVVGRRATPIYWHAYDQNVLKWRTRRCELAVLKRAFGIIFSIVAADRIRLTADRGFADTDLFIWFDKTGIRFVIRVPSSIKVQYRGEWMKLSRLGFRKNERRRSFGRIGYCEKSPQRLWVTSSRARNKQGNWGICK